MSKWPGFLMLGKRTIAHLRPKTRPSRHVAYLGSFMLKENYTSIIDYHSRCFSTRICTWHIMTCFLNVWSKLLQTSNNYSCNHRQRPYLADWRWALLFAREIAINRICLWEGSMVYVYIYIHLSYVATWLLYGFISSSTEEITIVIYMLSL